MKSTRQTEFNLGPARTVNPISISNLPRNTHNTVCINIGPKCLALCLNLSFSSGPDQPSGLAREYTATRRRCLHAAMPVTTGLRLGLMAANALRGTGLGHSVGWKGAAAAIAGLIAGTTRVPSAWLKRRHDKPNWTASDADMWDHINKTRAPWNKLSGTSLTVH